MVMGVVVVSSLERGQRHLDPAGPNYPILNRGAYPGDEQLFNFRDVLQLCSRAEERGSGEREVKVGMKGEVDRRVRGARPGGSIRRGGERLWRNLDGESTGEPLERDRKRDREDGETRPREIENHSGRNGEDDAIRVINIEFDALQGGRCQTRVCMAQKPGVSAKKNSRRSRCPSRLAGPEHPSRPGTRRRARPRPPR